MNLPTTSKSHSKQATGKDGKKERPLSNLTDDCQERHEDSRTRKE